MDTVTDGPQLVIFDLDGTLTDSAQGIVSSFRYALGEIGAADAFRKAEIVLDVRAASRLTAERDALSRESARWFDAAILAKAEQISQSPTLGRTRRVRNLARLFRADRASIAAAIADRARERGEWERAARFYLDALGSDAAVPELWLRLGDSLKAAGKSLEAEFAYRKTMALRGAPGQS